MTCPLKSRRVLLPSMMARMALPDDFPMPDEFPHELYGVDRKAWMAAVREWLDAHEGDDEESPAAGG